MNAAVPEVESPSTAAGAHPVDERLPWRWTLPLALQHLLAAYASILVTPLVLASALDWSPARTAFILAAGLFGSGIATLIQCLGLGPLPVGTRLPVIQGTTVAVIPPLLAIGASDGLPAMFGATLVAGAVCFLLAPAWSRLLRFFPPLVTGTVITVIGVSLFPVAVMWLSGGRGFGAQATAPAELFLGLGTFATVVLLIRFGGRLAGRAAILLGLLTGSLAAAALGLLEAPPPGAGAWLQLPQPLYFGAPVFTLGACLAMTLAMLVTMVESTGDYLAIGEICERPVDQRTLAAGLRAEGLATVVGGLLNAFPFTTFSQNVGVIRVSGIRSRYVVASTGLMLLGLGLLPGLARWVAVIPAPVLGGCALVLFGSIAVTGIQILGRVDFEATGNLVTVAASLGATMIAVANPGYFDALPPTVAGVLNNPIALGGVTAVALNLLFNGGGVRRPAALDTPTPPP